MKTIKLLRFALVMSAVCVITMVRAQDTSGRIGTSITVLGAVNKQGIVRLADATLISAIAESGGWTRAANLKQVAILRRSAEGKAERIVVDLSAVLNGVVEDTKLKKGDVVHIPEKIL